MPVVAALYLLAQKNPPLQKFRFETPNILETAVASPAAAPAL
jgi:hypothetical protein